MQRALRCWRPLLSNSIQIPLAVSFRPLAQAKRVISMSAPESQSTEPAPAAAPAGPSKGELKRRAKEAEKEKKRLEREAKEAEQKAAKAKAEIVYGLSVT